MAYRWEMLKRLIVLLLLPLGMGCTSDEGVEKTPAQQQKPDDTTQRETKKSKPAEEKTGNSTPRGASEEARVKGASLSMDERRSNAKKKREAAMKSGRMEQLGVIGMKIKKDGSDKLKAKMDALVQAFMTDKQAILTAIRDGSITEAQGKDRLQETRLKLEKDFERLAAKIK